MICPKCSKENLADALFCSQCANPLKRLEMRRCPRCGADNDPIFQFCRACMTDLDDPPERYAQTETPADQPKYVPKTTPYQSQDAMYVVKATPFVSDLHDTQVDTPFARPAAAFDSEFAVSAEAALDPALNPQFDPPLASMFDPSLEPRFDPDFNARMDALTGEPPEAALATAKRTPRRLKWLLAAVLALCALAFIASGVFSYMDRIEQSELPTLSKLTG